MVDDKYKDPTSGTTVKWYSMWASRSALRSEGGARGLSPPGARTSLPVGRPPSPPAAAVGRPVRPRPPPPLAAAAPPAATRLPAPLAAAASPPAVAPSVVPRRRRRRSLPGRPSRSRPPVGRLPGRPLQPTSGGQSAARRRPEVIVATAQAIAPLPFVAGSLCGRRQSSAPPTPQLLLAAVSPTSPLNRTATGADGAAGRIVDDDGRTASGYGESLADQYDNILRTFSRVLSEVCGMRRETR
ncbi:uncharacterized protein A4U43_C05F10760 [Asparagus officinalis]|uniref:Uncharacterized protein n=1 Tax=Asparagus officinalis TaxID=4686 RepID=A0A5P1ERC8_ASPOF|nr:uncharacterized protein A4U43_C05F10760 [Asparagus officinalis]